MLSKEERAYNADWRTNGKERDPAMAWYSVETPSVFLEYQLRRESVGRSARQAAKYRRLERLAAEHGTYVRCETYRRG
jgi:hypothetical protein